MIVLHAAFGQIRDVVPRRILEIVADLGHFLSGAGHKYLRRRLPQPAGQRDENERGSNMKP